MFAVRDSRHRVSSDYIESFGDIQAANLPGSTSRPLAISSGLAHWKVHEPVLEDFDDADAGDYGVPMSAVALMVNQPVMGSATMPYT